MSKSRLRALKRQFIAKFGRPPSPASREHTSELRTLKRAWRQYVQNGLANR